MEKKYFTLEQLDNCDFYSIFDDCGVKSIHILCYYWERDILLDDPNERDEDGRPMNWARTDGTFIIVPLEEFIANYKQKNIQYTGEYLWVNTKQYQYDMSEEMARAEAEGYYVPLHYSEITIDTPYGEYISL